MDAQSTFHEKVAAAEEIHRLRSIQARALLSSEEIRAQAEYYRTFETVGWYRNAFKVYRAAMAFAEGSYDQAVVGSVRMKYTEIITAWVECRCSAQWDDTHEANRFGSAASPFSRFCGALGRSFEVGKTV